MELGEFYGVFSSGLGNWSRGKLVFGDHGCSYCTPGALIL